MRQQSLTAGVKLLGAVLRPEASHEAAHLWWDLAQPERRELQKLLGP